MSQNARVALWVPTDDASLDVGDGVAATALPDSIKRIPTAFATSGGAGGGVPEAPADGKYYARKDTGWASFLPFTDAPADGQRYARRNGVWALTMSFPEAPTDGQSYARKNSAWVAISGGGGFPDAPEDGKAYGRMDGAWTQTLPVADGAAPFKIVNASLFVNGDIGCSGYMNPQTMTATTVNTQQFTSTGVTVVPTPTAGNQAANKTYVDNALAGISLDGGTF